MVINVDFIYHTTMIIMMVEIIVMDEPSRTLVCACMLNQLIVIFLFYMLHINTNRVFNQMTQIDCPG